MQVRTRTESAQFEKRDAFETKTHDRRLTRVARAFVPQTTVGFKQLSVFARETIKTRTTEAVFTFHEKAQRHRQFAERLLISLDGGKTRDEIALAVRRATRVQLAVLDR